MNDDDRRVALSICARTTESIGNLTRRNQVLSSGSVVMFGLDVCISAMHVVMHSWARWLCFGMVLLCTFVLGGWVWSIGSHLQMIKELRAVRANHVRRLQEGSE